MISFNDISEETKRIVGCSAWYSVYDVIEELVQEFGNEDEVNSYFVQNGIGWKLDEGLITFRSDEAFDASMIGAESAIQKIKKPCTENEIKEALQDLSRRPNPDITGAAQHAGAALESLTKSITHNSSSDTLASVLKKHPNLFPPPLDDAIIKIWGFVNDKARHIKERSDTLTLEDAELIVHLSASLCTYLAKKELSNKN